MDRIRSMTDINMRTAIRVAVPPFLAGRAISFGVGWYTVWNAWRDRGFPSWTELANRFSPWDGVYYRAVAQDGYPSGPLNLSLNSPSLAWGRFPGFPLAAHILSYPLVSVVASALVINAVSELIALAYIVRLAQLEGRSTETGQTAAWLLALFPYAIFLTIFYTEAPFIAATAAALYYMRRGSNTSACLAGFVATAVRFQGVILILCILLERWRRKRRILDPGLLLSAIVAAPAGLFMLYAYRLTGDALAYFDVQGSQSFNSHFTLPWEAFSTTFGAARGEIASSYGAFYSTGLMFALFFAVIVVMLWLAVFWKRLPRIAPSLALFSTLVLIVSLCVPSWGGSGRYLMIMVPAYVLGADALARRPGLRMGVIAVSGALAALGTSIIMSGAYLA